MFLLYYSHRTLLWPDVSDQVIFWHHVGVWQFISILALTRVSIDWQSGDSDLQDCPSLQWFRCQWQVQVVTSTSDQTARNQTSSSEICRNGSRNSEKLFDLLDQWFTISRETWNSPMEETYGARDGEGLRAGPRPIPAPVHQPGSSLTPALGLFMEASSHRRDWISHWPLVINLHCSPSPVLTVRVGRKAPDPSRSLGWP